MNTYLRLLLLPFSFIYGLVIWVRNKLYDLGMFSSRSFDIPVICVGNLAVGGSGKTPVTEYLVRLLAHKRVAILSRGYGRNTTGFILADHHATAQTIGDEPMQYFHKFSHVTVAVCEDRVTGISQLKEGHDVIILDDAYQHRKVRAGYNILLFEYAKLFKPQFLLPAGNLREPFANYNRAQAVLVTKAPTEVAEGALHAIRKKFSRSPQVFISSLKYQELRSVFADRSTVELKKGTMVFLLSGIANPKPLITYLEGIVGIEHHEYPDHHQFSVADIEKLTRAFRAGTAVNKMIVTTEKDAQRLSDAPLKELLLDLPVFYLPIEVQLHATQEHTFNQNILDYVSGTSRNR